MIPAAYSLKRALRTRWSKILRRDDYERMLRAPAYVFPDRLLFDSREVWALALPLMEGLPKLPHPAVTFEVQDSTAQYRTKLVYALNVGDSVEAVLFLQHAQTGEWSDVLAHGRFDPGCPARFEPDPRSYGENRRKLELAIPIVLWRSLAILSWAGNITEHAVPRTRRPKLARAGVRGWTWHQVEIVPERLVRRSAPQGGTHASPRWHIRRGHWRQLADGRRVFVRECQVGDSAIGGVLKDYTVGERAA